MNVPELTAPDVRAKTAGFCHIAVSLGSKGKVDEMTELMRSAGITILGEPRTTGGMYRHHASFFTYIYNIP